MKKFLVFSLAILTVFSLSVIDASAATTDFTADGNVEVPLVTFGDTTATMLIMNGSTSASWSFNSGALTITDPGTIFKFGSSDSAVKALTSTQGGNTVSCTVNANPGTSYGELPTAAGTYTIVPSSTSSCGGGGGAPVSSGGGGGGSSTQTTYQVSDPNNTQGTTTTTQPTTTTPTGPVKVVPIGDQNLAKVFSEAATIATGLRDQILAEVGKIRDAKAEGTFDTTVVKNVVAGIKTVTAEAREKILNFVTYGTPTTQVLGAGERGGVVNSFKEAFGKLPATEADWQDVVKIGNGRWPSQTSATRETKAETAFKAIYKRVPVRTSAKDDAAVVVMAYGLRPANRNLGSEAAASKTFKAVYGKNPTTATDWDTVRAIAYSGAKR